MAPSNFTFWHLFYIPMFFSSFRSVFFSSLSDAPYAGPVIFFPLNPSLFAEDGEEWDYHPPIAPFFSV